ncbi:hypothetical protein BDV12DRAFT_195298 [Aspergillus spectabilis]
MNDYSEYSYWSSQTSSPSSDNSNDMQSPLMNTMNHPGVYPGAHHGFNMTYMLPDTSMPSLATTECDFDSQTEGHHIVVHQLNLAHGPDVCKIRSKLTSASRPFSGTPTPTDLDSESQGDMHNLMLHQTTPITENHSMLSMKRRTQNRAAQRRFRKRKEDLQKSLEEKTSDLQQRCQEISDKFDQKSDEVSRLLGEKNALESEVQDLRKRWQIIVMLLQKPKGLETLSSLFADSQPPLSGSSRTGSAVAGDEFSRCLDALLMISSNTLS